MLKVCTLFKRKKGLTVAQYQSYWSGEHPNYVKRLPGLRRYIQNRPLPETFETDDPPYDGIVELYFDDSAALKHLATTQEYQELNADEENFVDRSSMQLVLTEETILKIGPQTPDLIKRVSFFKRAPGTTPEAFQHRWAKDYGAAMTSLAEVVRYAQSTPRLNGYRDGREPAWDGIDTAWFSSLGQARIDGAINLLDGVASSPPKRLFTREYPIIR